MNKVPASGEYKLNSNIRCERSYIFAELDLLKFDFKTSAISGFFLDLHEWTATV